MRTSFAVAFITLLCYVASQNSDSDDCVCLIYYLCRQNDSTIITDGEGLINERLKPRCEVPNVCCKFANQTSAVTPTPTPTIPTATPSSKTPTATPTTTPIRPAPDVQKCGFRSPDGVGFKGVANVQNNETEFGEFPWMVGILKPDGKYKCGGSLIHPSVVLTAAHCVIPKETFIVRAGEWDSTSTNEVYRHQERTVSSIKIHEDYRPGIYYNDIALLFFVQPFDLDQHIKLACLPPLNAVDDTSSCFATGWGKKNYGVEGQYPPILKEILLPMVNRDTCQENLRKTRLGPFFQLHRSFVCAGGEEGKDTCIGDGGGPLVCPIDGTEERYQQIGIVSWGIECGEKDVPGVYTNVASLRNWIDEQMKANNHDINRYQY